MPLLQEDPALRSNGHAAAEICTPLVTEERADGAVRLSDLFVQVLYKTLRQKLIAELTDSKISLNQIQTLRYIAHHPRVLIGDLAEGFGTSYASASNMVDVLESKDLVQRVTNPADRREVQVFLTSKGAELTERMESERVTRFYSVMDQMTEEEREGLLNGLHRFVYLAVKDDRHLAKDVCLRCGQQGNAACPIAEAQLLAPCL